MSYVTWHVSYVLGNLSSVTCHQRQQPQPQTEDDLCRSNKAVFQKVHIVFGHNTPSSKLKTNSKHSLELKVQGPIFM